MGKFLNSYPLYNFTIVIICKQETQGNTKEPSPCVEVQCLLDIEAKLLYNKDMKFKFNKIKQKLIGKAAEYMVIKIDTPPVIAQFKKDIKDSKVAFVTTAGVHLKSDRPFNVKGDHTYRTIPGDVDFNDLTITHDHYDTSEALKDINCVFPLEILRDLKDEGIIKDVSPHNFGFMGYIPETKRLIEESAPEVANILVNDNVDIVLLSPG